MPLTVTETTIHFDEYPEMGQNQKSQLTMDSLHGNYIQLLHFLISNRIITLGKNEEGSRENFKKFVACYNQQHAILEQYQAIESEIAEIESNKRLTNEAKKAMLAQSLERLKEFNEQHLLPLQQSMEEFNTLLKQIEVKNKQCYLRFVGDLSSAHGAHDWGLLSILDLLSKEGVNYTLLLSSHTKAFVDATQKYREKGEFSTDNPVEMSKVGSLMGMQYLLSKKIIKSDIAKNVLAGTVVPHLKLLDYSVTLKQGSDDIEELQLYSPRPVKLNIIADLAKSLKVDFKNASVHELCATIDRINTKFNVLLRLNKLKEAFVLPENIDVTQMTEEQIAQYPLVYLLHNQWKSELDVREMISLRPSVIEYKETKDNPSFSVPVSYVHGADSYKSTNPHVLQVGNNGVNEQTIGSNANPLISEARFKRSEQFRETMRTDIVFDSEKTPKQEGEKETAHALHFGPYPHGRYSSEIIYKENKHGNPQATRQEVVFSEIMRMFLPPNLTAAVHRVEDKNGNITGIAIDNICYSIDAKEGIDAIYYSLNDKGELELSIPEFPENIPYKFLNKLPANFFSNIIAEWKKGNVIVDIASLASILTAAYTLEEDDLHRGNIGVYVTHDPETNKPKYTFFKIDHDLLFSDSEMSYSDSRPFNWILNEQSFNLTVEDIMNFPHIKSGNFYWPTSRRYMTKIGDKKVYSDPTEIKAFIDLKDNEEFIHQKWRSFFKQVLISEGMLRYAADYHNKIKDGVRDQEDAELNRKIVDCSVERLAKLKAVLFSIPEFRQYVSGNLEEANSIKEEFSHYLRTLTLTEDQINLIITQNSKYTAECISYCTLNTQNNQTIQVGDSPLHIAIRMGNYRFDETHRAFAHYWNKPNAAGLTPLGLACEMHEDNMLNDNEKQNPGMDFVLVMKDLIDRGAKKTPAITTYLDDNFLDLKTYYYPSKYLNSDFSKAPTNRENTQYDQLKAQLKDLGQDTRLTIRQRKMVAKRLIKENIYNLNDHEKKQFKQEMKAILKTNSKEAPELRFLFQLRGNLWLVRKLRGQFGSCKTTNSVNRMINRALAEEGLASFSKLFSSQQVQEIGKYKVISSKKYSDRLYFKSKDKFEQGGFLHLDIHSEDREKAWLIISHYLMNNRIPMFSISKDKGKPQVSITIPLGDEELYQDYMNALESKLIKKGIRPAISGNGAQIGLFTSVTPGKMSGYSFKIMNFDKFIYYKRRELYEGKKNAKDEKHQEVYTQALSVVKKIQFAVNSGQLDIHEGMILTKQVGLLAKKPTPEGASEVGRYIENIKTSIPQSIANAMKSFLASVMECIGFKSKSKSIKGKVQSLEDVKTSIIALTDMGMFKKRKEDEPSSSTLNSSPDKKN